MILPASTAATTPAAPSPSGRAAADAVRAATAASAAHHGSSLPLIASENILSPRVAELMASDLHGRYAEGLPGARYYQGVEDFDTIEALGIELAKDVFSCTFANIQATAGTTANIAAIKALTSPGDPITAVSTADGGHISHARMGAVGLRGLDLHTYPWDTERMELDLDASVRLIEETSPTMCLLGQSVILFPSPVTELADAAHGVGARVMFDGAHVLGLIAGGAFPHPLHEGADVLTGSSHKTFPGPQGGFMLSDVDDAAFQRRLNGGVFPGATSSYHLHHVAGKVVALAEFQAFGTDYAQDTVANAKALAEGLHSRGVDVLAEDRGFTETHQVVTRHGGVDSGAGAKAAQDLEDAGIITNMNMLPGDTKARTPSGLRLGTPELTRLGMGTDEMDQVAELMARVLIRGEQLASVKRDVRALKGVFQTVRYCFDEDEGGAYRFPR